MDSIILSIIFSVNFLGGMFIFKKLFFPTPVQLTIDSPELQKLNNRLSVIQDQCQEQGKELLSLHVDVKHLKSEVSILKLKNGLFQ